MLNSGYKTSYTLLLLYKLAKWPTTKYSHCESTTVPDQLVST